MEKLNAPVKKKRKKKYGPDNERPSKKRDKHEKREKKRKRDKHEKREKKCKREKHEKREKKRNHDADTKRPSGSSFYNPLSNSSDQQRKHTKTVIVNDKTPANGELADNTDSHETVMKKESKTRVRRINRGPPFNAKDATVNGAHDNEIQNATQMTKRVLKHKSILFNAQPQSGKTLSSVGVALHLFDAGKIETCVVLCGSNETKQKEDFENKIQAAFCTEKLRYHLKIARKNKVAHQSTIDNLKKKIQLFKYAEANTRVRFNHDMQCDMKCGTCVYKEEDKLLIIIDECHYGNNKAYGDKKANILVQWLDTHGLLKLCTCKDPSKLPQALENKYVVAVSATPSTFLFHNQVDVENLKMNESGLSADSTHYDTRIVRGNEGTNYYGIQTMLDNEQLRLMSENDRDDNGDISESLLDEWFDDLDDTCTPPNSDSEDGIEEYKYIIIRLGPSDTQESILQDVCTERGYKLKFYDSDKTRPIQDQFKLKDFNIAPDMTTVVVVRGLLRMGHTLVKKYIAMMIETTKMGQGIAIAQGLLGRGCGYAREGEDLHTIIYYLPEAILPEIESYGKNHGLCLLSCKNLRKKYEQGKSLNCKPCPPIHLSLKMIKNLCDQSHDKDDTDYNQLNAYIVQLQSGRSWTTEKLMCQCVARLILKNGGLLKHQRGDQIHEIITTLTNASLDGNDNVPVSVRYVKRSRSRSNYSDTIENLSLLQKLSNAMDDATVWPKLPQGAYEKKRMPKKKEGDVVDKQNNKKTEKVTVYTPFAVVLVHDDCQDDKKYPKPKKGHERIEAGSILVMLATDYGTPFVTPCANNGEWVSNNMSIDSTEDPEPPTKRQKTSL